jgi:hypothetical protein
VSAAEAQSAAATLVTYIRAAMRLANVRSSRLVEVNAVRVIDAAGRVSHHVFAAAAEAMAMIDSATVSINGAVSAPPQPIPIDKALTDARVAEALEYLARDESWVEFYKAFVTGKTTKPISVACFVIS